MKNINDGFLTVQNTAGSVLIDVRTEDEFDSGHIPGSINIPLDSLDRYTTKFPTKKFRFSYIAEAVREASRQSICLRKWATAM